MKTAKYVLIGIWGATAVILTGLLIAMISGRGFSVPRIGLFEFPAIHIGSGAGQKTASRSVSPQNIKNIRVDAASDDVSLGRSDDGNIHVILRTSDGKRGSFKAENSGGTLQITDPRKWTLVFGSVARSVEIDLPKIYEGGVACALSAGDLNLAAPLKLGEASFETQAGDITATGGTVTADSLDIETSKGDVTADALSSPRCTVSTSMGDVKIRSFRGAGEAVSKMGDVTLTVESLAGALTAQTSMGDVKLTLASSVSARLNASTSMGDVSCPLTLNNSTRGGHSVAGEYGSGPYQDVTASSSMGDVTVSAS